MGRSELTDNIRLTYFLLCNPRIERRTAFVYLIPAYPSPCPDTTPKLDFTILWIRVTLFFSHNMTCEFCEKKRPCEIYRSQKPLFWLKLDPVQLFDKSNSEPRVPFKVIVANNINMTALGHKTLNRISL